MAAFLQAALASSCTNMLAHEKVDGWPELQVIEHRVSSRELDARCAPYAAFGRWPIACAQFFLAEKKCVIWLNAESPPSQAVVEHERLHCQGYDHAGSTAMRKHLERWKEYLAAGR